MHYAPWYLKSRLQVSFRRNLLVRSCFIIMRQHDGGIDSAASRFTDGDETFDSAYHKSTDAQTAACML
jgi:hypothetical protein